jgi:hypothetical protein
MKRMNQRGTVLVSMLLLLAVVTIMCVMLLNLSTIDIQIMGNLKKSARSLDAAEGGADSGVPIIEYALQYNSLPAFNPAGSISVDLVTPPATRSYTLLDEISGVQNFYADAPETLPNLTIPSSLGVPVYVDIDRLYSSILPGGSLEFASGYEGVGVAAGGGGVAIYFRIDGITL